MYSKMNFKYFFIANTAHIHCLKVNTVAIISEK